MSKKQARVKSPDSSHVSKPRSHSEHFNIKRTALKSHRGERDVQEIMVFHQELHRAASTIEI